MTCCLSCRRRSASLHEEGFLIVFLVGFGVVLKLVLGLGLAWAWVWACDSVCVCVWVWSWAWAWAVTVWVQDVFVCFQNRLV